MSIRGCLSTSPVSQASPQTPDRRNLDSCVHVDVFSSFQSPKRRRKCRREETWIHAYTWILLHIMRVVNTVVFSRA
ncbi:hypothetical protein K402DRAFT_265813 [Aulographum hederae CBS 113979]|uniref:Uncharacterized protein n=1 Tax=Aulographum hederae CBS 113979 TaxID=1176131 RepID=A0A6G1GJ76_9PEZI|nr:hypothetical protein K402DRAFT_265813 [Aulographum hederae CBS 113979]